MERPRIKAPETVEQRSVVRRVRYPADCNSRGGLVPYEAFSRQLVPYLSPYLAERLRASCNIHARFFGNSMPFSVIFSYDVSHLYMDYAVVDPEDGWKGTHDTIKEHIDYVTELQPPGFMRTGHFGEVTLSSCRPVYVALLDRLQQPAVLSADTRDRLVNEDYRLVRRLVDIGIYPVTSDGYPVQFAV